MADRRERGIGERSNVVEREGPAVRAGRRAPSLRISNLGRGIGPWREDSGFLGRFGEQLGVRLAETLADCARKGSRPLVCVMLPARLLGEMALALDRGVLEVVGPGADLPGTGFGQGEQICDLRFEICDFRSEI